MELLKERKIRLMAAGVRKRSRLIRKKLLNGIPHVHSGDALKRMS
jgi:hypothetical protein